MTKEELLTQIGATGVVIVSYEDYHKLFPGRVLTAEEMEIRLTFAQEINELDVVKGRVSRRSHNPKGNTKHDRLHEFTTQNNLSFKLGRTGCVFFRGNIRPESPKVQAAIAAIGEPEGTPFKMPPPAKIQDRRKPPERE